MADDYDTAVVLVPVKKPYDKAAVESVVNRSASVCSVTWPKRCGRRMGANTEAKVIPVLLVCTGSVLVLDSLDLVDGKQLIREAHRELGGRSKSFSLDLGQPG